MTGLTSAGFLLTAGPSLRKLIRLALLCCLNFLAEYPRGQGVCLRPLGPLGCLPSPAEFYLLKGHVSKRPTLSPQVLH